MDKTPITNFALRLSSTKSTGQQSDKGFQDVTAPFQFLTGNNQASKSQGFHLAGPSFLRSSFNLPENPKIHENTPTKEFNAETNYSPFRFPGLRAGGNLTSTGGEKPTVQSVSCEQVVQELDQGLVKPKEESAETLPTGTSEPEEDLFLTITTKYRQAQREAARQVF
ncbi:hypothetical protein M404DRAFT_387906 [Pisolithus tinctorius Marx 270]|uniref:Uncharacterized protein n=1 Tax=Pisolithus tinctorius Marx 270 TaxID=870435 RepID=A0A0C3KD37_PISTI|nr:hypothetical protein M404DRAFT_387906 [Pisolithus tinctorius Marx 270]